MKSLSEIQAEVGLWANKTFGEGVYSKVTNQPLGSLAPLMGMAEELGELNHCVLKHHQGIKGFDDRQKYIDERNDALADILIFMCHFADKEGVDLEFILNETWEKIVSKRTYEGLKKSN